MKMTPINLVLSGLVILLNILYQVASVPYPPEQQYYDHLGIGPFNNDIVDYYSKPKYAFGYEVDGLDEYFRELSHGRWEIRDGDVTRGQYRVLLPDQRIQIVSYIADKFGYRPTIKYVNKGILPPPPPHYAHVKPPKFVPIPVPVQIPEPHQFIEQEPVHHPYETYGAGFGYGLDPFVALGSTNSGNAGQGVARAANPNFNRKRALLYNSTLFRKDVERKKRRSGGLTRAQSLTPSPMKTRQRASSRAPATTTTTTPETDQELY